LNNKLNVVSSPGAMLMKPSWTVEVISIDEVEKTPIKG
jgi:hypothetical protein